MPSAPSGRDSVSSCAIPSRRRRVRGDDARRFLNGLLTSDVAKVTPEIPQFAALLTPQGKILFDGIVTEAPAEDGGAFFIDCPRALAASFVDRLGFYKAMQSGERMTAAELARRTGTHERNVREWLAA